MAQRRMLNVNLISSDDFCNLPHMAQLLYLHLNMNADDDGLVGNATRIMRSLGIQKRYLATLTDNGYLIPFESGVVAITHWHCNNHIRKDRYVKTRYINELSKLKIDNGEIYKLLDFPGENGTFGQPNDNQSAPQYSIDKESIGKNSLEKDSIDKLSKEKVRKEESVDDSAFEFEEIQCNNPNIQLLAEHAVSSTALRSKAYTDTLTEKQKEKYNKFLYSLNMYLMINHKPIDVDAFIKYNEDRRWKGRNGESVITNYKEYVEYWERNENPTPKRLY